MKAFHNLTGILFICLGSHLSQAQANASPSQDPSLSEFELKAGLTLEAIAAAPLTASPCALAWDDQGRLLVVENRGYPVGSDDGTPKGMIAMLEDLNADGQMDTRTVFARNLTFPNGIIPWKGGFFITCAPDIIYLKDTNGDNIADLRQVVLTGFATDRSTQLRVSHPTLGPDGWIYITSGLSSRAAIRSPLHPDREAVRIGTDARFNPTNYRIEAIDGRGQFGHSFNDIGDRFHCMNRIHVQHTVLSSSDLERHPNLPFSQTVQNVPEAMFDDLLSSKNVAARTYPISENLTTADSHAGSFSAACGIHIYRGNELPSDIYGDAFVCDPTGNLVRRDRLTPTGPTYSSHIATEGREFLASRNNHFRPVFLGTGPDGALYVCDMNRPTIEHPDYLPVEIRKRTDFEQGKHQGFIWRIGSEKSDQASPLQNNDLSQQSPEKLIELLGHANSWQRETAFRLLIEKSPDNVCSTLATKLSESVPKGPRQRTISKEFGQQIGILNQLNALLALSDWHQSGPKASETTNTSLVLDVLRRCIEAESPALRVKAWRNLKQIPNYWIDPETAIHWAKDPNPKVRFEFAITAGNTMSPLLFPAFRHLAIVDGTNTWSRAAILSGLHQYDQPFSNYLQQNTPEEIPVQFWHDLGRTLSSSATATKALVQGDLDPNRAWHIALLGGILSNNRAIRTTPSIRSHCRGIPGTLLDSMLHNLDTHQILKASAIQILGASNSSENDQRLVQYLMADTIDPEIKEATLKTLFEGKNQILDSILRQQKEIERLPTSVQLRLISLCMGNAYWLEKLLTHIADGNLSPALLKPYERDRARRHRDAKIRKLANQALGAEDTGDRIEAFENSKRALALSGSAAEGRELFLQQCASCHRLDQAGANVGPDLFGIRNQPKESILLHIIRPNYEIQPDFMTCEIETSDGELYSGIKTATNQNAVTLMLPQGIEETIPRTRIHRIKVKPISLRPEGFEAIFTPQELANLLAYLRGEDFRPSSNSEPISER